MGKQRNRYGTAADVIRDSDWVIFRGEARAYYRIARGR
jgi:hypothetical protein